MAHEDMTVDDVLDLVDELRPVATQARKKSDVELGFVMYDAFSVRGSYDDYGGGSWGFGVILGEGASVSSVFGRRLGICGTRDEVRAVLKVIDRYARLRLGSEYLEAYEAAHS
ncbi:hypothetical protein [Glaciibacter superstes]|uniref:hypothetical protein n=1 Tax=Glaciibacter superstes TaxID=501023 RepID=UPI0012FBA13E|nr:hypothetical protein [Glaciibacter superstes]